MRKWHNKFQPMCGDATLEVWCILGHSKMRTNCQQERPVVNNRIYLIAEKAGNPFFFFFLTEELYLTATRPWFYGSFEIAQTRTKCT